MVEFYTPEEILAYEPPKDLVLVGDCQIQRGGITVLGGAAGIGKSLATTSLAVSGATGKSWLGLPVHHKFKTLIVQAENGLYRLHKELKKLDCPQQIYGSVKFSEPLIDLRDPKYCKSLDNELKVFKPGCVVLDPFNSIATDDTLAAYTEALEFIQNQFLSKEPKPAVVIVAHPRKPKRNETKPKGRELMHELTGSLKLTSRARCVFMLESTSKRGLLKLTCAKNNDGEVGGESLLRFEGGQFVPETKIRLSEVQAGKKKSGISLAQIKEILEEPLTRKEAVSKLLELTSKSNAYALLAKDGPYSSYLVEQGGKLHFVERPPSETGIPDSSSSENSGGENRNNNDPQGIIIPSPPPMGTGILETGKNNLPSKGITQN